MSRPSCCQAAAATCLLLRPALHTGFLAYAQESRLSRSYAGPAASLTLRSKLPVEAPLRMRVRLTGVKHDGENRTRAAPNSAGRSYALQPIDPLRLDDADSSVLGACRCEATACLLHTQPEHARCWRELASQVADRGQLWNHKLIV